MRDGILCNKWMTRSVLENKELTQKYFGTSDKEEAQKILEKEVLRLTEKHGDYVQKMKKPSQSWSWFLETDDSELSSFCFKSVENLKDINPKQFHQKIIENIKF